ncbi:hypothetical protein WA158_004542 [Blastocystis sp. Blastoise]
MSSARISKLLSSDSESVWNATLSPGWNEKELHVLRLAIMKYGVGSWKIMTDEKILPGKNVTQIVGQVQRMMGQQSLREYLKINLDPFIVGKDNSKRKGVTRKNGMIINDGNTLSADEFRLLHNKNKEKYALSKQEIDGIIIPKLSLQDTSNDIKISERVFIDRANKLRKLAELRNALFVLTNKDKNLQKRLSNSRGKHVKRRKITYSDEDDNDDEE